MNGWVTHGAAFGLGVVLALAFVWTRGDGATTDPATVGSRPTTTDEDDSTARGRTASAIGDGVEARGADPANVTALRKRIEELEAKLTASEVARAAGPGVGMAVKYFGHSQAELEELARNCDIRTDAPGAMTDEFADDAELTADERAAYDRAYERWQAAHDASTRAIYRDATGEELEDPRDLSRLQTDSRTDADRDVGRHIAEERAGLREPPGPDADLSVYERIKRLGEGRGDAFERELAKELGPDRAHELRGINDGWPGARQRHWGCPEDEEG